MIIEIGHFSVVVALVLSVLGIGSCIAALRTRNPDWVRVGRISVTAAAGFEELNPVEERKRVWRRQRLDRLPGKGRCPKTVKADRPIPAEVEEPVELEMVETMIGEKAIPVDPVHGVEIESRAFTKALGQIPL